MFGTKQCTKVLLCAVFTWHTSNWRKRKLQERISQRNKKVEFIIKVTERRVAPVTLLW